MTKKNNYNYSLFTKGKLSLAIASVLLSNSIAYAQEKVVDENQEAEEIEVITVTGFRGSATRQLNNKRFSKNVSDSIFAEDMGKMPDANIAEAMSRITGIGIDRIDGEGSQITIRGVEGSLNNVQMNGVNMASTNSNAADEENAGSIDFSMMSADMLRSIEVIKSPSANHDEGSLGATVRLNTWKPLDIKEPRAVVNAKGVYNDLSEEWSPNLGLSFGENFSDNFGLTASVNYSKNTVRQDSFSNWNWRILNASANPVDENGESLTPVDPEGSRYRVYDPINYEKNYSIVETENMSASSTIQYKFNDNASVWLDFTYSQREKVKTQYNQTISHLFQGVTDNVIDVESGSSLVVSGPRARARNVAFEQPLDTDNTTIGLNYQHILFDGSWTLDALIGYSGSNSNKPIERSRRLQFNTGSDAAYVQPGSIDWSNGNGGILLAPEYTIGDQADGSFPSENIPTSSLQYLAQNTSNENFTYQLDLQGNVDFGPIVRVATGVKVVSQETNGQKFTFAADLGTTAIIDGEEVALRDITLADYALDFPASDYLTRVVGGSQNGWDIPDYETVYNTFAPDPLTSIDSAGRTLQEAFEEETPSRTTFDSQALYLMADYELFDGKLLGDFGVRYVKTEALARGRAGYNMKEFIEIDDEGNPIYDFEGANFTVGDTVYGDIEYDNWLPSFNARFMLSEEMLLRGSVAKVMARPRPNRLVPGYLINTRNPGDVTASGGNPQLEPTEVIQYDLAWEWYFQETAMVAVNLFYKDFLSMVYQKSEIRGFSDSECASAEQIEEGLAGQGQYRDLHCALMAENVDTSTDVNGDSGSIYGTELAYQQDFLFLPGWAKYFGTIVNYTYADSEASYVDAEQEEEAAANLAGFPMRNTSKHTLNATLYWENEGFSARIAANYRSKRLSNPSQRSGALWVDDRTTLDFSARYKVTKALSFDFSATNLTDSYNRTFITLVEGEEASGLLNEGSALDGDTPDWRTYVADHNGRNFRIGVSYKF
ncbi:TonB-dependent receptor [Shewanella sp. 10N.7]|uniref:TonB-dependent receptor n=1 Tax=Shewanella sp. 10N.7 TaxID=2885093 RepID=UPI001E5F7BBE|nr:TonB-dependent receptor [Shewanella sp. 10N.7]MCC4831801.1 TonB-dependent receptor [Shewanella sp. 10N.7]